MNVDPDTQLALRVDWYNVNGSPVSPSQVFFQTRTPSGAYATYSVAGGSVAIVASNGYEAYPVPGQSGSWRYRWTATSGFIASKQGGFLVNEDFFP
jgi:hypothetical protein